MIKLENALYTAKAHTTGGRVAAPPGPTMGS